MLRPAASWRFLKIWWVGALRHNAAEVKACIQNVSLRPGRPRRQMHRMLRTQLIIFADACHCSSAHFRDRQRKDMSVKSLAQTVKHSSLISPTLPYILKSTSSFQQEDQGKVRGCMVYGYDRMIFGEWKSSSRDCALIVQLTPVKETSWRTVNLSRGNVIEV